MVEIAISPEDPEWLRKMKRDMLERKGSSLEASTASLANVAPPAEVSVVPETPDIAVLKHRADEADRRMERMEGKLDDIGRQLTDLKVGIAGLQTKSEGRGQMLAVILAIVGAVFALWQVGLSQTANERSAIANMLSSFQAGIASRPAEAPPGTSSPVVIQIPTPPAPAAPQP